MKISVILVAAFVLLAGCRSKPVLSYTSSTFPEVGTIATAEIGEPLLQQGDGFSVGTILIQTEQKIGDTIIRKGKYLEGKQNAEYTTYKGVIISTVNGGDRIANLYLFNKDKGTKIACTSRKTCGDIDYTLDQQMSARRKASFQQTLLYSGKIGDKITLGYREFSSNLARPAFSNDVTYDLSASTTLGYKGARLEVIKATNTEITYKVVADFDKVGF